MFILLIIETLKWIEHTYRYDRIPKIEKHLIIYLQKFNDIGNKLTYISFKHLAVDSGPFNGVRDPWPVLFVDFELLEPFRVEIIDDKIEAKHGYYRNDY